jgi:hypothetical protein
MSLRTAAGEITAALLSLRMKKTVAVWGLHAPRGRKPHSEVGGTGPNRLSLALSEAQVIALDSMVSLPSRPSYSVAFNHEL